MKGQCMLFGCCVSLGLCDWVILDLFVPFCVCAFYHVSEMYYCVSLECCNKDDYTILCLCNIDTSARRLAPFSIMTHFYIDFA